MVLLVPIALLLWTSVRHAGGRSDRVRRRGQPGLHRGARRGDRGRRRLHGRAHRLVQQPDLRGRHPGGARHRAAAGRRARAERRPERRRPRWLRTRCSRRPWCSRSQPSPTTTCRTSRPASWSAPPRGSSRSRWSSGWSSARLVIPPVLDLLNTAFGFAGAPGAGENALAAPQAALISALAEGVFGGDLNWGLIGLGALVGAVVIVIDEVLARTGKLRLPPLAVGMGMYLPMALTLIIPLGALLGRSYDRWAERRGGDVELKKRLGVLMATGLIVGESLFGVVFAGIVAASGSTPRWPSSARASRTGRRARRGGFVATSWRLYRGPAAWPTTGSRAVGGSGADPGGADATPRRGGAGRPAPGRGGRSGAPSLRPARRRRGPTAARRAAPRPGPAARRRAAPAP